RLHNGTVYRWNRPVYDVVDGKPHLRVENRVLPAGPTVSDILANAAFYYGAMEMLAHEDRPMWSRMSFSAAEANFTAGARDGVEAMMYWPGYGQVGWDELVLRHVLPLSAEALAWREIGSTVVDRFLGVIEARRNLRRNRGCWQSEPVARLEAKGMDWEHALTEMLGRYMYGIDS